MSKLEIPARLYRAGAVERADAPADPAVEDDRRVRLSFSSEAPVERWFGWEVLGHRAGEVDLSRFAAGVVPLLADHRATLDSQIGVVETAEIVEGRGTATVRFGKGARASEILARVRDGEITGVSVGYRIIKVERAGERDGFPVYRATLWTPLEVSLVPMPADESVGIGRGAPPAETLTLTLEGETPMPNPAIAAEPVAPVTRAEAPAVPKAVDQVGPERARIRDIQMLGRKFKLPEATVDAAIEGGATIDAFHRQILDHLSSGDQSAIRAEAGKIGMNDREVRRYSLVNAINYLANPNDAKARAAAGWEIEVSQGAADRLRTSPKGLLIPVDVLSREDFAAGQRAANLTAGSATAGADLVATDLLSGSFIDLLRRKSATILRANPTTLGGLVGNVAIPKLTGGATAYWVGEDTAPTASGQTFDQATMSPHTVGAITEISRKLLLQASVDVEAMVRRDIGAQIALAIDGVGLNGSADVDAPNGLADYSAQINAVDLATAGAPTWAEVVGMESAIAADDADVESMAYIFNATMRGYLKSTPKVAGHPTFLMEGGLVNGYPAIVSNQSAAGDIWLGNWADFVIGLWSGLDLTVDPYSASATGAIRVIAFQDVDFAIRHAESFCLGRLIP